jgi:hypothetical protein
MLPTRESLLGLSAQTWRLPIGDGRVACPLGGSADVERCMSCGNFIGYVEGAVICSRSWSEKPLKHRR